MIFALPFFGCMPPYFETLYLPLYRLPIGQIFMRNPLAQARSQSRAVFLIIKNALICDLSSFLPLSIEQGGYVCPLLLLLGVLCPQSIYSLENVWLIHTCFYSFSLAPNFVSRLFGLFPIILYQEHWWLCQPLQLHFCCTILLGGGGGAREGKGGN